MSPLEEPVHFYCNQKRLFGIFHSPTRNDLLTAVTIVTGGSQTRIGSHRLYLQLARYLSNKGLTVLRFDYEGMGDSEGEPVGFPIAAPSIDAAQNFLRLHEPELRKFFIWSICDGALASLNYATFTKNKTDGLILCNPFVMNESERSRIMLKNYFLIRFFRRNTWLKLFFLRINLLNEIKLIVKYMANGIRVGHKPFSKMAPSNCQDLRSLDNFISHVYLSSMPITFILSSEDIIATSLWEVLKSIESSHKLGSKNYITYQRILGADHTFTDPLHRDNMFHATLKEIIKIRSVN